MRAGGVARAGYVVAATLAGVVACSDFEAEPSASVAGGDGGGAESGLTRADASTPGFCASRSPAPFFCDEFTGPSLEANWRMASGTDAGTSIRAVGPSPPSAGLHVQSGLDCAGDHVVLVLRRDLSLWEGGVRIEAKLNVDEPTGAPAGGTFNGGPAVELAGAGGLCSFYVGWDDGIPRIKVDLETATTKRAPIKSFALLDAPVASGRWLDVQLDVIGSATGTDVRWTVVDGRSSSAKVPECTWSKPQQMALIANCSAGALDLGVDDVALSAVPPP